MNILYVHPSIDRSRGIEGAIPALAEQCAALGHSVSIASGSVTGSLPAGVRRVSLPHIAAPFTLQMMVHAAASRALRSRQEFDIIHGSGLSPDVDVVTAHSCHRAALRILKTDPVYRPGFNLGIADAWRVWLDRRMYRGRHYQQVIAVSHGVKNELMTEYGVPDADVHVIPNGVDLDLFHPDRKLRDGAAVRNSLRIPADAHVLLFVGNEFSRKGLGLVIESLNVAGPRPCHLLVLGRDDVEPYRQRARALQCESRVHFLGSIADPSAYYAAADLMVFPTAYEAFPIAAIEAMAAGVPLIATRTHGIVEILEEGNNGFFVVRDVDSISGAIRTALQSEDRLRDLSRAARETALSYSWRSVAGRTIDVYTSVLDRKRSRRPSK